MAYCSPGTSAPIGGYGAAVIGTAAAIAAALLEGGIDAATSIAVSSLIAGATYDPAVICAEDPPGDPGLTALDLVSAFAYEDPLISIPAILKIRQWFLNFYWHKLCQCVGATTPNPPALALPTTVNVNPGLPGGNSGTACWSSLIAAPVGNGGANYPSISLATLFPNTSGFPPSPAEVSAVAPQPLPASYAFVVSVDNVGTNPGNLICDMEWYSGPIVFGNLIRADSLNTAHGTTTRVTLVPPAGTVNTLMNFNTSTVNPTNNASVMVTIYCAGQSPGNPISPCCPPDPSVDARLNQILGLVTSIFQGLPTPLTSYAESTVHAGLTGNGTILLSSQAVAVKVSITTDAPWYGSDAGSPDYLFDRGYIVPVTNEAPIRDLVRLVYNPQLYTLPALTEQIGYSLKTGLVVSITELVPGP